VIAVSISIYSIFHYYSTKIDITLHTFSFIYPILTQTREENRSIRRDLSKVKQIIEDERLLSFKGIQSVIDPDARLGWNSEDFLGNMSHANARLAIRAFARQSRER
jgi:hypothetical protein